MSLYMISEEIIAQSQLRSLASDGWIFMEIRKGVPGLKHAGRISNNRLQLHLAKFGYAPVSRTPSLWKHATKKQFSLVVDDFGVKYVGKENSNHLIQALSNLYTISVDWTVPWYCVLTLDWYYTRQTCNVSMPSYLPAALHKLQYPTPSCPQDSPHA